MSHKAFQINGLLYEFDEGIAFQTIDLIENIRVVKVQKSCIEQFLKETEFFERYFLLGNDLNKESFSMFEKSSLPVVAFEPFYFYYVLIIGGSKTSREEYESIMTDLNYSLSTRTISSHSKYSSVIKSVCRQLEFLGFFSESVIANTTKEEKHLNVKKDSKSKKTGKKREFDSSSMSKRIVQIIANQLAVHFLPIETSRKAFADRSGSFGLVVSSSKKYLGRDHDYWFALEPANLELIENCGRQYLGFGCQNEDQGFVVFIPMEIVKDRIQTMRASLNSDGTISRYHVDFVRKEERLFWVFSQETAPLDLSDFIIEIGEGKNDKTSSYCSGNVVGSDKKLPALPDMSLKIGDFVRTAMRNLSYSGFTFTNEAIDKMCSNEWTFEVFKRSNKPFMRRIERDIPLQSDTRIDGFIRFWNEVFFFGDAKVLISKEWYEYHRNRFVDWYNSLECIS